MQPQWKYENGISCANVLANAVDSATHIYILKGTHGCSEWIG